MERSFTSKLARFESNLWTYCLPVPENIASDFKKAGIKRMTALLNDSEKIYCAILSSQDGPFLLINAALRKKHHWEEGSPIKVVIKEDQSKYGMPLSEAFSHCLDENPIALAYFEKLSPGKQRNLIHLVNKIKDPNIQVRRSLSILDHLERENGELDFKKLNEVIKEYNQRFKLE